MTTDAPHMTDEQLRAFLGRRGQTPGETKDAHIEKLNAELGELRRLLWAMTDDDECDLDHHGYCQTHNWFDEAECPNRRARRYFDESEPA